MFQIKKGQKSMGGLGSDPQPFRGAYTDPQTSGWSGGTEAPRPPENSTPCCRIYLPECASQIFRSICFCVYLCCRYNLGLERYWHGVIGYWAIFADIGQFFYWVIFFHCDTQCDTDQTAVSTIHMITTLTSVMRPLSVDDSRDSGEEQSASYTVHRHHHRVLRFYIVQCCMGHT